MEKVDINLSVIKGEKLFNENTPFVINIMAPESKKVEKTSHADLICVIDISGSMFGTKIELVKKSLKILVQLMDKDDRICLILFDSTREKYFDLNYLTEETKKSLYKKINKIEARGGTNIISGLELAIDVLMNDKDKEKPNRSSSILLLSDGCDNYYSDAALICAKLKELTKGKNLDFTLNAFGYGDDHDPKIMKGLSSIRDGTFFYVEKYEKVADYFGIVLGTCTSTIAKKAYLVVELLNKKSKITKIFGEEYFYSLVKNPNYFSTTILQFISGKEYTYVFECELNNIKKGQNLLQVDFIYQDNKNKFCKKSIKYKYGLLDNDFSKANEEYIRSQVYYAINKSLELKGQNKKEEAKKILNEMKEWLDKNKAKINEKQYVLFLNDIEEALKGYEYDLDDDYDNVKYEANMNKLVMGNMKKNAYDFYDDECCNKNMNCNQEYYARNCNIMFNDDKNEYY